MSRQRMTISWDDLKSPKVEEKLAQQDAIKVSKEHYNQAQVPAPSRARLAFSFCTTQLSTWIVRIAWRITWVGFRNHFASAPNAQMESRRLIAQYQQIDKDAADGRFNPTMVASAEKY